MYRKNGDITALIISHFAFLSGPPIYPIIGSLFNLGLIKNHRLKPGFDMFREFTSRWGSTMGLKAGKYYLGKYSVLAN